MESGDTEKAKSHHTELHRGGKAPVKKSAAVQNSQQAQQAGAQSVPLPTHAAQPVWNYSAPAAQPAIQQFASNTSYYPAENRRQAPVTLSQLSLTSQPPVVNSPTIPHHTLGAGDLV